MEVKMCTCFKVAEYFLSLQDGDAGNSISNMKLQKLLYYAQGFAMVILDKPLFEDDFEAWEYGPVIRKIYDKYKSFGSNALPKPDNFSLHKYSKEEKEFLNEIYDVYGQYSAWALSEMVYKTPPWKDTLRNSIISKVSMKKYFSTRIVED
jgi:uncharacterized phage-associated protein